MYRAPFSAKDSAAIESIWQVLQRQNKRMSQEEPKDGAENSEPLVETRVPVNEDQLFEVDVAKREIYPAPNAEQIGETPSSRAAEAKAAAISKPELVGHGCRLKISDINPFFKRWALFGPWMNSFVVFTGSAGGWLFSDQLSSKWARAFMSGLTRGENQWGTRLVRGWSEVEKLKKGSSKAKRKSVPDKTSLMTPQASSITTPEHPGPLPSSAEQAEKAQEKFEAEDYNNEGEENDRQINHLVLVIHGIGQKLGERLETVNFVHDCSVLRHAIKDSARNIVLPASAKEAQKPGNRKPVLPMPELGGVQVLPVQWRQKINFGRRKDAAVDSDDHDKVDIEEITLEGVPSIRMLVSDVALDVLLYMTPKYRQEMVKHVAEEMNRIYSTFIQRNPKFNGKVSIYGHSLGSLLAFDILCNQPTESSEIDIPEPGQHARPSPKPMRVKGMSEVDLSDMLRAAISSGPKEGRKVHGLMEPMQIKYEKLNFEVDKLFGKHGDRLKARRPECLSDPGFSMPAVGALYNIFHPHVARSYAHKKPAQIQYNKGGLTRTIVGIGEISSNIVDQGKSIFSGLYSTMFGGSSSVPSDKAVSGKGGVGELTPAVLTSSLNSITSGSGNATSGPQPIPTNPTNDGKLGAGLRNKSSGESLGESNQDKLSQQASANTSSMSLTTADDEEEIRRLNTSGRIDYVLQEGVLENAYLSSLSSHMTYWPDQDIAVFILKELYSSSQETSKEIKDASASTHTLGSSPKRQ
ncbi:hypothetical protein HDU96_005280 [Phlyctochytrium bullatum]|nr:hypothetical protein HDU96_005280 [Phlyctochytrium bullatum]